MNGMKRALGFTIVFTVLQAMPGFGQGTGAIRLQDPHPGFPNQLLPQSINNRGDITGHIGDERDGVGFIRTKHGAFQEFVFPGTCEVTFGPCTYPAGINDRGQIVGRAIVAPSTEAFLRERNGTMITLPRAPDGTAVSPNAINARGEIVGTFGFHGFLLRDGNYTTIDFPGATRTACTGVNNSGEITGFYIESGTGAHGFLWERGNFVATFQFSDSNGPSNTFPVAINDEGQVAASPVEETSTGGSPSTVAFVRNPDGTFTTLNLSVLLQPIGSVSGALRGINNRGDLVGWFSTSPFDIFGFLIPHGARLPEDEQGDAQGNEDK